MCVTEMNLELSGLHLKKALDDSSNSSLYHLAIFVFRSTVDILDASQLTVMYLDSLCSLNFRAV